MKYKTRIGKVHTKNICSLKGACTFVDPSFTEKVTMKNACVPAQTRTRKNSSVHLTS